MPRSGYCLLGRSDVLRVVSRRGADGLLGGDAAGLGRELKDLGVELAYLPRAPGGERRH